MDPRGRPWAWNSRSDELLEAAQDQPALPGPHARRDPLDLQEQEIKDAVLRMGSLVEEAIRRASLALTNHDCRSGPGHHQGGRADQRRAARGLAADQRGDRHPAAGRARPALPADAGPRHLRAGADRRPRLVGREAGHQARSRAAARRLREPPRDGRTLGGPRPRRPARARRRGCRRGARGGGPRTTTSTACTTRPSTRSSS